MSSKRIAFAIVAVVLVAVVGSLLTPKIAYAGSGSFTEMSVTPGTTDIGVHLVVSCPGDVGYTWRVGLDSFDRIVGSDSTKVGNFTIPGSIVSNGHHNVLFAVRCNGEPNDWSGATTSQKDFDWYGGNDKPPDVPTASTVGSCNLSLSAGSFSAGVNVLVGFTANGNCNPKVRSFRWTVDGIIRGEESTWVTTFRWSFPSAGSHTVCAIVSPDKDDDWSHSVKACATGNVTADSKPAETTGGVANSTGQNQKPVDGNHPNQPAGVGASMPDARDDQGGASIEYYCQHSSRGGSVEPSDGDPNKWRCADGQPVDMNAVCIAAYGNGYHAYLDPSAQPRKYAWRCGTGQDGPNPPPQVNPPNQPDNSCPSAGNPFKAGDIAIVADADPSPLDVYSDAGNGQLILQIPIREPLSIVGPEKCLSGYRWVQIGYRGKLGWAILVGPKGLYNLVANKPMPQQPAGFNCDGKPPARLSVGSHGRTLRGLAKLYRDFESEPMGQYPEGTTFVVLDGPSCGTHNVWYRVRVDSDGATGWFAEGRADVGYWLEPIQSAPPITPTATATPAPQETIAQNQPKVGAVVQGDPCGIAHADEGQGIIPKAYAADGTYQCIDYVREYFAETLHHSLPYDCANGLAENWAATAGKCRWLVDQSPRVNTVVVWASNCPPAKDAGHVAVVVAVGVGSITVNEANWFTKQYPNGDGKIHLNVTYPIRTCMSYIHVTGVDDSSGSAPVITGSESDGQVQAGMKANATGNQLYPSLPDGYALAMPSSLHVCNPTCGVNDWVEFILPVGNFDPNSLDLHFAYLNAGMALTWKNSVGTCPTQPGGAYQCVRVQINGRLLKLLLGTKLVKTDQVQDPASWYLTFKRT